MLKAKDISIEYGSATILRGVSLTLAAGKIICVVGANGAGKTTLIRSLNGTLAAASGAVLLDEKPLKDYSRSEIAQRITVVAQENETKFPITVAEFILAGRFAGGSTFGWEGGEDVAAAETALEECGLAGFASRLMNELSGGERQRVVLARALATGAEIFLLDEPTANLDLANQAMMFRLVRKRCRTGNFAAIVVTHDLNLAAEFSDEIVLLKNGEIFASGRPDKTLTANNIKEIFGVDVLLDANPVSGKVRITMIY